MDRRALLVVIGAVCFAGRSARAQQSAPQPAQIETSGQGEIRVTPDRATVSLGVQTHAQTAEAAGTANAKTQQGILDTLRALGFTSAQLTTANYSVSPEYDTGPNRSPRPTGYVVTNTVRVEVTHVEQIPSVIDASLAKGATNIAGVEFSISNAEDVRRDALTEAVRKARADAEAMAKAAGGSLGNLIELTTSEPGMRPVFAMAMKAPTGAAMNMPTPIEPGERSVMATVTARWQFKPGGGRERKSGRLF